MPRQPRNSKIDTREARLKLQPSKRAYTHRIVPGLFLGYRKGSSKSAGSWIMKCLIQGTKRYSEKRIGLADDNFDSDDENILSFKEAVSKAQQLASVDEKTPENDNPELSVEQCLDNYLEHYCASREESKTKQMTNKVNRIKRHPMLQGKLVTELRAEDITRWHHSLVKEKLLRGHGRGGKTTAMPVPAKDTPEYSEYLRRRKCTANNVLSTLRAALNHAWRLEQIKSNDAWMRVKPFRGVDQAKIRFLTLDETERLLRACPPTFRNLVQAALETGARYGALTQLTVGDYLPDAKCVHLPGSITKNGKSRSVPLTEKGAVFFDSITAGRRADERIFLKENGKPWVRTEQGPHMRRACKKAGIEPPVAFHILRHTTGSLLAQRGVPLQVIATLLGHSDTRITQKHYAHLCPDYVADVIRENLPDFSVEEPKVVPLSRVRNA